MASSCCPSPSPYSRRGRFIASAFILLAGLVLSLIPPVEARAQRQPTADISALKTADVEAVRVGGTIRYSIGASNAGPDAATNVVLTDVIPANTTFVSVDMVTGGGTASFDGTTLTITYESIPGPDPETGEITSVSARLTVRVNDGAPRGTVITNTVTATASSNDPQTFDNSATVNTNVAGPFAGDLLISEFRLRGPAGATDEYIEVYNNADTPHLVQSTDDSSGYAVVASDGALRCTIPNETVIPARGHFLCANSAGYSLGLYPAGEGTTATPDATYTADIPDNAGLAVFRTSNSEGFNVNNRFDAVGSTAVTNGVYREGTGYPALSPLGLDYAFYRDNCGKAGSVTTFGNCPTGGLPRDTNNNAADFIFVSPDGNSAGAGARLGAPGPENLSSPTQRNSSFSVTLLDPCVGTASAPNRARSLTSDPANNSTFGTLDIRRTVTNSTGQNVTRLRWRIIDITTHPTPGGVADLRARSSTPLTVTVDRPPCGSGTSQVVVQGTTLEQWVTLTEPPSQPPSQPLGGGFNSTLSSGTITLDTPLLEGQSMDVRFLLGIQKTGAFKFFINVEALTRDPVIIVPGEEIPPGELGGSQAPAPSPRKGAVAMPGETSVSTPPAAPSQNASAPPVNAGNGVSALPVRRFVVLRVLPPSSSEAEPASAEAEPAPSSGPGAKSNKAKRKRAAKARQTRRERE